MIVESVGQVADFCHSRAFCTLKYLLENTAGTRFHDVEMFLEVVDQIIMEQVFDDEAQWTRIAVIP